VAEGPIETNGASARGFAPVEEAFASNFDLYDEVGASVAVVIDGRPVVDLWGGHLDRGRTAPWERDTIINVWSTTKTMTALVALMLASRGALDLDAPVADYWPEFEANGKDDVLVRHVLSHTAGLPSWDEPLVADDLRDRDRLCSMLAAQPTWWEPGSRSGYHALTHGYLIGELVRRCDGRSVSTFFADEVAGPLGADFHLVLDASHDHRVAPVIPEAMGLSMSSEATLGSADPVARRAANVTLTAEDSWTPEWRRSEIPAAAGCGNARSVALAQSVISAGGTIDGVEFVSAEIIDRIFDVQAAGRDLVLGAGITLGVGYALNSPRAPMSPNERVCFWGGWGGSLVVNDLDAGFTMAYVMNRMGAGTVGDQRAASLLDAVYRSPGLR
jgi:CubicO group peptidase (beta-lactamase class C family)